MDLTIEGGYSLRVQLAAGERNSRRQVERLHREPPLGSTHLWDWFVELRAGTIRPGSVPTRLTFSEIAAWAALTRVELSATEVSELKLLDETLVSVAMGANRG